MRALSRATRRMTEELAERRAAHSRHGLPDVEAPWMFNEAACRTDPLRQRISSSRLRPTAKHDVSSDRHVPPRWPGGTQRRNAAATSKTARWMIDAVTHTVVAATSIGRHHPPSQILWHR